MSDMRRKSGAARAFNVVTGRLRIVVTASIVIAAFLAGAGVERFAAPLGDVVGSQQHDELTELEEFDTLVQTYDLIREGYVLEEEISDEDLVYGASRGMMEALGDEGHSTFLDPEEAEEYYESLARDFVGIGVFINTEGPLPVVTAPIENSHALEAGILPGDEILAIDGELVEDYPDLDEFVDLIAGEEGTDVVIELRHVGDVDTYEVTITRQQITYGTVSWAMLPNDVMWLRISAFEEGTGDDVVEALEDGKRLGAEGVVLDLRGNPGGLIVEEIAVASQFLPEGSVISVSQDSEGEQDETVVEDRRGEWREGPLVVLINENTVSAAEVTAAAIAENDRGVTIGQTTFGTGTSLALIDLEDGSMLFLGVELWLTPDENVIWHQGLDPMIEIANEPHVPLTLPYMYEDNELTDEQFAEVEDDQLLTGYEEILELLEDDTN